MPNKMSKDMPKRLSEDMPKECQKEGEEICQTESQKICKKEEDMAERVLKYMSDGKKVRRYARSNVRRYVRRYARDGLKQNLLCVGKWNRCKLAFDTR